MDLKQLKAMGLVTTNPMIKHDLEIGYYPLKPESDWADPAIPEREAERVTSTITVYLKRYNAADLVIVGAVEDQEMRAWMSIQRSTYTETGDRLFPTLDDAIGLDLAMFGPLLTRINKINEGAKKNSPRKMNSGASLPLPSVDEALPNGKSSLTPESTESGSSTAPSSAH
jgi:hypothetical protein